MFKAGSMITDLPASKSVDHINGWIMWKHLQLGVLKRWLLFLHCEEADTDDNYVEHQYGKVEKRERPILEEKVKAVSSEIRRDTDTFL